MKRLLTLLIVAAAAGPLFGWWDFWPDEEHQALLSRSIDIVAERYPDMAAEVTAYRDQLLSGTHVFARISTSTLTSTLSPIRR